MGDDMFKKRIIIGSIAVFILSFLFHFGYDKFPSFITSIFCPVNESIFEHNKMIASSFLVFTILEKIFAKSGKSIILQNFLAAISCIVIVNIVFTPIYLYILHLEHNIVITFIVYGLSIFLGFLTSNKFIVEKNTKAELIGIMGFITLYIVFTLFTYFPPKFAIFYDFNGSFYGIK